MHGNSIPHNSNSRMWITYKQMRFFFGTKLVIKLGRDNSTNLGTVTLHTERLEVRVAPLTLQWTMLDTCIEEYSQNRTCLY